MRGDKVITVTDRLASLEKGQRILRLLTGALVVLHLSQLAPLLESGLAVASVTAHALVVAL